MKKLICLFVLALFGCCLCLRAENPEVLSLVKEKNYPVQGFIGLSLDYYSGDDQEDYVVLPNFYYGTRQVSDWEVWNTPVEFDLGRSAQLSIRNIEGTPWTMGIGLNYNATTVRERDPSVQGSGVPGYSLYSAGPYAYGRYQATKEMGFELSERLDYIVFEGGENAALRPDDYWEAETRLLIDYDLRHMDPRPEVRDCGFYVGGYGFARQRQDDISSGVAVTNLRQYPDETYGFGGLAEYLWQPWLSGNFGIVLEGEMTLDTDPVRLGRTDLDRGRGHFFPHFLLNQDVWPGGSIEFIIGPDMVFDQFGQSSRNPTYFHSGLTLSQSLSEHLSIAISYEYNDNRFKPTHTGRDQTGPQRIGITTSYRF